MSQLQHIIKLLPGPRAQVEGVAGVVGEDALQVGGAAAHDEDGLHEGGDVAPAVSRHHRHPGPVGRLTADLLLVEGNEGVLVVMVATEAPGHHGHVLTNLSTGSKQDRLTRLGSLFLCLLTHLGPDSHFGNSSGRNSLQDVKSWQTASSYHLDGSLLQLDTANIFGFIFTRSISNSQPGNGIFQYSQFCWCCCILPVNLTVRPDRPRNKILKPPWSPPSVSLLQRSQ